MPERQPPAATSSVAVRFAALLALTLVVVFATTATGDGRLLRLLFNTLKLGVAVTLIAVPWGVTLAVLLTRTDLPGRRTATLLLLTLLFVPLYLQAAGWDAGFGRQGWFSLNWGSLATPVLEGWRAAIWIHSVSALPWVVLITGLGLRYIESEFEELALLEASAARVFWRVTLRRSLPAVVVAALWVQLAVAGEMTVTDLYQVRTLAEEVYLLGPSMHTDGSPWPWTSLLVALGGFGLLGLGVAGWLAPRGEGTATRWGTTYPLAAWRGPAAAFVATSVAVVLGVPLLNLIVNAGIVVRPGLEGAVRGWELGKFWRLTVSSPWRFAEEFHWTLMIGSLAGTISLLVAVLLAWLACRRRRARPVALLVATIGLAVPGPVLGLLIIWMLNRDSEILLWLYDRTLFAPVMAMVLRSLPLALLISWYALRSVAADALELAALEGAGSVRRLSRIVLPQRAAALMTAWLAAVAITMGDLSATILVTPPGVSTVALRVFGLLHAGVDDQVAGLCLTSMLLFFVVGAAGLGLWPATPNRAGGG